MYPIPDQLQPCKNIKDDQHQEDSLNLLNALRLLELNKEFIIIKNKIKKHLLNMSSSWKDLEEIFKQLDLQDQIEDSLKLTDQKHQDSLSKGMQTSIRITSINI